MGKRVQVDSPHKLFLQTKNLPEKQTIMSLPNRAANGPCLPLRLPLVKVKLAGE